MAKIKSKSTGPKRSSKGKAKAGSRPKAKKPKPPNKGSAEGDIEKKVEKEAKDYKRKLTTTSRGAFTPSTVQRKRTVPIKKTWKPKAAGGILLGMALIGIITSSNLVLTAVSDPLYSPETGSLKGFVLNEDGERLAGAFVQLKGTKLEKQTNENGKFKFKDVPKGEQTLFATYPGYITVRFPTMVLGGTQFEGIGDTNLTLPKANVNVTDLTTGNGPVKGTVLDNNRNPEQNATVMDQETKKNVTTGPDGSFDLGELPVGQRDLVVSKTGYRTKTLTFYSTPNRAELEVLLTLGTGTETQNLTSGEVVLSITVHVANRPDINDNDLMVEFNGTVEMGSPVSFTVPAGRITITATGPGLSSSSKTFFIDDDTGPQDIEIGPVVNIRELKGDREALKSNLTVCGSVIIFMSIFILITGYVAIRRRKFWVAVTGSLFGSVFMLVTFQYGIIMGLVAFGLLLLSRREFE